MRIFLGLVCCVLWPLAATAQTIDAEWRITKFTGESWFVKLDEVISKTQSFNKGMAEGALFNCPYAGLSATYNTYTVEEFLVNKEFELFRQAEQDLREDGGKIFVHRITCAGLGGSVSKQVFYPFVTTQNGRAGYYMFEGGYFTLHR